MSAIQIPSVTTATINAGFPIETSVSGDFSTSLPTMMSTQVGAPVTFTAIVTESAPTSKVHVPTYLKVIDATTPTEPAITSNEIPEHVEATFPGSVTFPTNYGATATKEVTTTSSGFGSTTITKEVTIIPGFGRTTVTKQVNTNQGFGGVHMAPTTTTMTSTSTLTVPVISQAAGRSVTPVKVHKESKEYRIRGLFGRERRF